MAFAIICDSTADLRQKRLDEHHITRVPLYINFQNKMHKDWLEITPNDIIAGVEEGADLPKTSQPTPIDFQHAYKQAAEAGKEEVLCLTISSELSGTYQSATIAAEDSPIPVTVFDSRSASWGIAIMVLTAARLRDEGRSLAEVMKVMEHLRDNLEIYFTVGSLEFLQKGGRIGRASALLGNLLNIKPILGLVDGSISAQGRARGMKRALREMLKLVQNYQAKYPEQELHIDFVNTCDTNQADKLRQELQKAEVKFTDHGSYELGGVITSHVGGGTFGLCLYTLPAHVSSATHS